MSSWLGRFQSAEPGYEAEVVERYTLRLLELARRQLPERVRRRVDPEDVVQSVYRSFFRRLNDGQFNFDDSHDIWRLLAAITFRKSKNAVKFQNWRRGRWKKTDECIERIATGNGFFVAQVRTGARPFRGCVAGARQSEHSRVIAAGRRPAAR